MCGIAGIIDFKRMQEGPVLIRQMLSVLDHRGPDGTGYYSDGFLHLGHSRLSIIDLESGKQPMSNEDGTVWVTFNGEIYNFQHLKEKLQIAGHVFNTNCDTEVIVHSYEEYGPECVDLFRGMFAFAVWDSRRGELFISRDRLGKKPLYYYYSADQFIFASEIKSILQYPEIQINLDFNSLKDYFNYSYIPSPKTIYEAIHKLPPAHSIIVKLLKFSGGSNINDSYGSIINSSHVLKISRKKYWDLHFKPDYSKNITDWKNELEEKLIDAVRLRLVSDVPLGAFLSGGIDSSSIVALMCGLMSSPVKTFSIGFDDQITNELKFARIVSERFKTDHHEMIVTPDAISILQKLAWQFDEPFSDSSAIPTYYVSKIARENVSVILSGDGGDEAFAGYSRYAHFMKYDFIEKIPLPVRAYTLGLLSRLMPFGMKGRGILRNMSNPSFERYAGVVTFSPQCYFDNLFSDDFKKKLGNGSGDINGLDFLRTYYNKYQSLDPLSKQLYTDLKTYLPEDILTKVDRASMLCSLETRAPLLDHILLEFVATIPSDLKLHNGITKYIFKEVMGKYLPRDILYRKKMGFDMPLAKWFKDDFLEFSKDVLFSQKCRERGFFNHNYIRKMLEYHQSPMFDLSANIWSLVFFENWCQVWLDK